MSSVQPKEMMAAGSVKPAVMTTFHQMMSGDQQLTSENLNPLNNAHMKQSAAAAAAALKAAERHASFVQHHPSKDHHHHVSAMKEPMSPAVSVVSTHCGGSPHVGDRRSSTISHSDRSMSNMSNLELHRATSCISQLHLEDCISEVSDTEGNFVPRKNANTPVTTPPQKSLIKAPVHCPKLKGEAQPVGMRERDMHQMHTVCEKTQKIIDEAHHFGLCEHYAKLLDQAKEVGFKNIKWPTNFTMFHLAAKKNNKEFIEWLVRNDFDDLHTIDDFGKKPIDYACPKKRDSVHTMLSAMMLCMKAPLTAAELKYQQVKAGTWVDPAKVAKQQVKKVNCMAAVLQSADIAEGDNGQKAKPSDMMSAFEAEQLVPVEYKKCFKKMSSGGWSAMEGAWPNQGTSVLHWAARNGKEELCHFLIVEYNADPKEEDGSGHDAIYHAKLKRHRKLAKKLLLKFKEPKMSKGKKK